MKEKRNNFILEIQVPKLFKMDTVNKSGLTVALMKANGSMACKKVRENKIGLMLIRNTKVNGV